MGHQVEYVIDLPPPRAREWLSTLPGWWAEPGAPGQLPYGEFEWGGRALHADLGPMACQVRVPEIKYSWLIGTPAPSLAWVARFEDWLSETLPGVRAVRLDEVLRLEWEAQAGRPWEEIPDPVGALRRLLPSREDWPSHFRVLSEERPHAGSGAAADSPRG
jgi:hypothetical protein